MYKGVILVKEKSRNKAIDCCEIIPCKLKLQADDTVQVRFDRNRVFYIDLADVDKWYESTTGKFVMVSATEEES